MKKSSGRAWPIGIAISITMVFSFCVGTVVVTQSANIQESDAYMTHYQDADANVNKLIKAEIAFNKKYNIIFQTKGITQKDSLLTYSIRDTKGNAVNNAELILAISRPEMSDFNTELKNPTIENGIYQFSGVDFPKEGVWNLVLKVKVAKDYKFYNVKVDTRNKKVKEF